MIIELVWAGAAGLAAASVGAMFAKGHRSHKALGDVISGWHGQSQLGAEQAEGELRAAEAALEKALAESAVRPLHPEPLPVPAPVAPQVPVPSGIRSHRQPVHTSTRGRRA